jgi:hypothetical protein
LVVDEAEERSMPERFSDFVALFMGALAVGYTVYEIERRRRKLHDLWDVLGGEDAELTAALVGMVASGELEPYAGEALA